jgi:nucleotide-binding universal stress UspA family protein
VILGLLFSVPILVWGSSMLLKYVERYPALVYLGAGVLAFTAAKMMTSEPALKDALEAHAVTVPLIYLVTVLGVLWTGFAKHQHRLESRISARLADWKKQRAAGLAGSNNFEGESVMEKVLVPVDGSHNTHHAVRHVINELRKNGLMEVHLLNVQTPFSKHVAQFVSRKNLDSYHRDEAAKAFKPIRRMLDAAHVAYSVHVDVGHKAEVITQTARRLGCDRIVMATARKNSLTRMLEASVTNRVVELTTVPVEVIAGDAVSRAERYGIPMGIAGAIGLVLFAFAD